MTIQDKKLAEEILEKQGFKITCHRKDADQINDVFIEPLFEAMETYHEAKLKNELINFLIWWNENSTKFSIHDSHEHIINQYLKQRNNGTI